MAFNYKTEYDRYKRYYQNLTPVLNKPKNHQYTAVVFSFLAVSLFGWYAIRPTIQTILFLKRDIADKKIVNQKMEEKISNLIEAYATFEEIEQNLLILDQALPSDPSIFDLAGQIRTLGAESGVILVGVQAQETPIGAATPSATTRRPAAAKLIDVPITIVVNGEFTQIQQFLQGLANLRRITSVDTALFQPISVVNESTEGAQIIGSTIQLTIQAKTYYYQ